MLLAENQPLTRIGIRETLSDEGDIEIAGETDKAAVAFQLFQDLNPDVTILGLRLADGCTIDGLDNYFARDPKARIIVFAEHAGDAEISKALKKGALGYICKDVEPIDLVNAIRTVNKGKKYIPADVAAILSESYGKEELTP
ncbi:MAG: response regulator, partial [Candidatus Binatia bacterium]